MGGATRLHNASRKQSAAEYDIMDLFMYFWATGTVLGHSPELLKHYIQLGNHFLSIWR